MTPSSSGASYGYVGGGGAHYTSNKDTVGLGGNASPSVNAGQDQSLTLPSTASLSGIVSDDGLPNPPASTTKTWSKTSGPGTVTFANANAAATTATFSTAGTYVLRLTASDSALSSSDEVTLTVSAAGGNVAPTANAGSDQTITLPAGATLTGDPLSTSHPARFQSPRGAGSGGSSAVRLLVLRVYVAIRSA